MKPLLLAAISLLVVASSSRAATAERPRGISLLVPGEEADEATELIGPGPRHRILYVNRRGGVYTPGWDDSSTNTASVLSQTSEIPASRMSEAEWSELFACIRDLYAPFAITVTDVEPPPEVAYVEGVVGGRPGDAGFDSTVGGVAPIARDCSVVERAVTFTFSDAYYSPPLRTHRVDEICWTLAQESGHALGLDHALHCPDPMTYLRGCGPKAFRDVDAPCGEDVERTCLCGAATQNSVRHLLAVLGPADHIPPTVELLAPGDGDTVTPRFSVEAHAEDLIEVDGALVAGRVDRVELWIDGEPVDARSAAPYRFEAPAALAVGPLVVEVRAYDGHDNAASASATIVLEGECTADDDCPAGRGCVAEICLDEDEAPDPDEGDLDGPGGPASRSGCSAAPGAPAIGNLIPVAILLLLATSARRRRRDFNAGRTGRRRRPRLPAARLASGQSAQSL